MAATFDPVAYLQRTLDNYTRIWLLVTEAIAEQQPTGQVSQATVDTIVGTIEGVGGQEGSGVIRPKITTSEDGKTYNWLEYQQALNDIMKGVKEQLVLAIGPYDIQNTGGWGRW
jgi:hypothetical protein